MAKAQLAHVHTKQNQEAPANSAAAVTKLAPPLLLPTMMTGGTSQCVGSAQDRSHSQHQAMIDNVKRLNKTTLTVNRQPENV